MFNQQTMKPQELLEMVSSISEFFCIIRSFFPKKCYQTAIYKYDKEYYILTNPKLLSLVGQLSGKTVGNEELILDVVDEVLENNQYTIIDEEWVKLDLRILAQQSDQANSQIYLFKFGEDM